MPSLTRTFQTRIDGDRPALAATAALFSRVARTVDAALARGAKPRDLAKSLWEPNGILAKNLDHILRQVQGKRKAVVELAKLQVEDMGTRIAAKERQIARRKVQETELPVEIDGLRAKLEHPILIGKARKQAADALRKAERTLATIPATLHQHARRLDRLRHMLAVAEARVLCPGICHGSRELFLKQFHLAENGYDSHADWLMDWRAARSSQFMVEGEARCPSGNQFVRCQAMPDGSFDLEVRLPPALHHLAEKRWIDNGYAVAAVYLRGLRFAHGSSEILAALKTRQPLTWRFIRDATSWRVMVMVGQERSVRIGADWSRGALGADLNADHVALCHVTHDGNPLRVWRIPLVTYGLSEGQRLDLIRRAVDRIRALAEELGLPVVSETLDFGKKKAQLTSDDSPAYARTLSSFAYRSFHNALRSALVRAGIRHETVNPAFTSLIGRMKFARQYGLSTHAAASLSIARRAMGHSERLPGTVHAEDGEKAAALSMSVPLDDGDRVTLPSPVRMRSGPRGARRHVWSCWGRTFGRWKAAREAHVRAARQRARSTAASGGSEGPESADASMGISVAIARGRRRPPRKDVGATACPGAGDHAKARTPRRDSPRESG